MFKRFCLILSLAIGMVLVAVLSALASVDTAWVRVYNELDDIGGGTYDIAVDVYGNVYVTGYTDSAGMDYATIKYDSLGNMLWLKRYNGPGDSGDAAEAIALDSSGHIYVTGGSIGIGTYLDYATVKYYPCADTACTAWVRRYDGPAHDWDEATAIAVDDSGNVYVTGWSDSTETHRDCLTIKYDSSGNVIWVKRYAGENGWGEAAALEVDGSGNVYVTGFISGGAPESGGTGHDYVTIKYSPNGDTTWIRTYNGLADDEDEACGLAVDDFGNVYVTGHSCRFRPEVGELDFEYATVKYNSDGNTAWVKRYNPTDSWDGASAIALDHFGDIHVTGSSDGDYATIKYYPCADTACTAWVRRYEGGGAYAMALDTYGNVYVTGECHGIAHSDYGTVKYEPDGNEEWAVTWNGPGNRDDEAYAITVDEHGNVYVTGGTEESDAYDDCATIRYVQDTTDVKDETGDRERPSGFTLFQNYPNPFNQATKIEFTLAKSGFVSLNIYDILGRKVRTLVSEHLSSGYKSVLWDGKDNFGNDVASGIYFYRLRVQNPASGGVSDFSQTKKLVLLK